MRRSSEQVIGGGRMLPGPTTSAGWSTHRWLVLIAVGYQWFYNGANFLAFKVAGEELHPLMVATLRFSLAALILLPAAILRWNQSRPSVKELSGAALVGVVMLVAAQALAIWGTHYLPAGVAAVFGSSSPLFLALFAWAIVRQPMTGRQMTGVGVGFIGLALMGWSSAAGGDFRALGAMLTLAASAAWAAGSLLAPRLSSPSDPVVGLTMQLAAAGLVLGAVVALSGVAAATHFARVSFPAWGALGFLIVASTLIGYAVFLALNSRVSPTIANTFNYAAPVIAMCLSALLLNERLTAWKLCSGGVALVGVALMIDRRSLEARSRAD